MSKLINLKDYKNKKKMDKIVSDIDKIVNIFTLTQKSLSFFKTYAVVQEVISIIETNKSLLLLHKKKYSDIIEAEKKK